MTIVKRGSKFRVISGTGKNLGESPSKAAAVKRLKQVEFFKYHAKCIVDPSLIKGNEGMQQYVPVIFNVAKPKDKEAQKLDFPSTTKQLELKDVKQPEFPSTPFTGEAYAQSFHNPRPSNTVKDGTHVIVQGDTPHPQEAGPFKGEHGPDTQFKGSDYVPKKTRKSIMLAGKRVIIKGSEGSDNSLLRDYPIDRGESGREFDANNERQARKDFFDAEKMKEKNKAYEDAKRSYAPGNGPSGLNQSLDARTAYLGRSNESDLEKGVVKVLGTAIKNTVKDSLDKEKRQAEAKKIAGLTSTVKKAFGKFMDSKSDMKVLSDKEIKAKQKADKDIVAPKKVTREIRVVKKAKGIMRLILQYTQNQPLAAGFKPLLAHLVKDDEDDEENLKGPRLAKKAMSTSDIAEKISKFPSKGPSSTSRIRLMERASSQKTENTSDEAGPHPDFGPSGGYKGDTSKLGKGEVIDIGVARKKKMAQDSGGIKKISPSEVDWSRVKPAPTKHLGRGSAMQMPGGEGTVHSEYGKPTKVYKYDKNKQEVGVYKEKEGGEFSAAKKIPAHSGREKELKEASIKSDLSKGAFKDKWIKQQESKGKDPSEVPGKRKTNPLSIGEYTRRKEGSSGTGDPTEGWPPDDDDYSEKSSHPNPIKGGIGDELSYDDVDEKELEEGVKVEQEHVKNSDDDEDKKKVKAADIALDHLAEDDKYYTKLAEMERSGKEGDKAETKKKKLLKIVDKSFVFKAKREVSLPHGIQVPPGPPIYSKQSVERSKQRAERKFKKWSAADESRSYADKLKKVSPND